MASAFNLTAQINIAGPSNIKPVVGKIQKQLSGIQTTVDIKIDKRVAAQIRSINKNISSLNQSIKSLNTSAQSASKGLNAMASSSVSNRIARTSQSVNSLSRSAKSATGSLQNANKQLAKSNNLMQAFGKHVSLAAKKFAAFSLVTGVIYRVSNAIDVAVSEFVEFNRELIKVSQVTGTSMQGLTGLERTIRNLSTGLGVSSQSLVKIATTLAQAGLTADQTRQAMSALAKTTLAPTFGDVNDTVEGSIALMRQFSIETKDLERALGSINAVASQFAVESQDIITAIKRAGGVFAAASKGVAEGTDALNQFIAIFTSVRATTREGAETIATGLRTIFTRIQRGDTIEKLKAVGVELTDLEGKFVGPYEAVRRLSIALGGLDPRSSRFAAIAEELGGFRQIGKVIPLLQQFNTAQAAYFAAQKGGNSLTKDATIAQQALAVQFQKTREQFVSFVASLSNNQGLKNLATLALKAAQAILKVAEAIGPALPALSIMLGGKVARAGLGMLTGKKFATGGMVPGTGSGDTVPAMLTPGEFVIRKKAVDAIGASNLHKMNKYAGGGSVAYGDPLSFKTITGARQGGKSLAPRLAKSKADAYKQGALINAGDKFSQTINEKEFTSQSIGAAIKGKRGAASIIQKLSDKNPNIRGAEFENFIQTYVAGAGKRTTGNAPLDFIGPPGEAKFQTKPVPYPDLLAKTLRQRIDSGKYASLRDAQGGAPSESLQSFDNIYSSGINLFKLKGKFNSKIARDAAGLNQKTQRKRRATGGGISGQDTVPALLTPGEFVINKKAASRIGASKLHTMNRADKIAGYNKGGFVQKFAAGGGVDDVAAGLSRKDAAMLQQAAKSNIDAFKELEQITRGWPADDVASAYKNLARSINKGEADMSTALDKAVTQTVKGSGGSQRQAKKGQLQGTVGFQEDRTKQSIVEARVAAGGLGMSGDDVATADRETDKAKGRLEAAYGAKGGGSSAASEKALKVFRATLLQTNDATKAMAAAERAAVASIQNSSAGVNKAFQQTEAASKSMFPTFNKLGSALGTFGTKLAKVGNKMTGGLAGKAIGKVGGVFKGQGAGAVMARQMGGAALTAAAGMGVSALSNAYKGPDGEDTDTSRTITSAGGGALSGAAMGAQIGMMFGPWGAAIGGAAGALVGFTKGLWDAAKENAKAAAQEKKNREQKFAEGSQKSLDTFSDASKSGADRMAAREVFLGRSAANMANQKDTNKALKETGSNASERAAAFSKSASQAVQFFTTEATRTGKSLSEMEASMSPQDFAALRQSILMADEEYQKTLDAKGNETAASKAAADKALENVAEMTKTNAELAKQRKAIQAMAKVSASYVRAARNLEGAIAAAETNFDFAAQEMATITDPTASVSIRNRNLETVTNPASSAEEQQRAYSKMASGLGSEGQAMAQMAAMPRKLEADVTKTLAGLTGVDDSEKVEKDVKATVKNQLMASGVDEATADQAAGKFAGKVSNMSAEDRANMDVQKEIAGDEGLSALMDGANASAQALQKYSQSVTSAFQFLADQAKKTAEAEQGLRDAHANSIGQRMANEDRMNAILGRGQGIQDKLNRINEKGAAQRNARMGQTLSADPVEAAQQLRGEINVNQAAASVSRAARPEPTVGADVSGDVSAASEGELAMSRFAQKAKTAEEELRKIPGQLQGSIDAVLSEMESVVAHRAAQIDAGAGLMEKALSSTPSEMMKMSKTMNLASAAAQGFAPTIQQSEAAQKAYAKTIRGGGSQQQAQSAAQQAYAQESGDSLNMLKEMMPLLTAAGPEGKAEANKMMANAYEAQFAARGIDINQTPFGKIIEMMRQGPENDPQVQALQAQYDQLEQQKQQTEAIIAGLDQERITKAHEAANKAVVDKLEQIRAIFQQRNAETEGEGGVIPGASGTAGAVPGGSATTPPASTAASAGAASSGTSTGATTGGTTTPSTATTPAPAAGSVAAATAAGSTAVPPGGHPFGRKAAAPASSAGSSAQVYGSTGGPTTTPAQPSRQQQIKDFYAKKQKQAQYMQRANTSQGRYGNAASQAHAQMMQQRRIAYARRTGNTKGLRDEDKKYMQAQNAQQAYKAMEQSALKQENERSAAGRQKPKKPTREDNKRLDAEARARGEALAKEKGAQSPQPTPAPQSAGSQTPSSSTDQNQTAKTDASTAILETIASNTEATVKAITESFASSATGGGMFSVPPEKVGGLSVGTGAPITDTTGAAAAAVENAKQKQETQTSAKPQSQPEKSSGGWMGAIGSVLTAPARFTGSMVEGATGFKMNEKLGLKQKDAATSAGSFVGSVASAPARLTDSVVENVTGVSVSEKLGFKKKEIATSPGPGSPQKPTDGVNTNGLAQFTDKLNKLFDQLANISIPSEIKLTGAFDVSVVLNGAEVLSKMEPKIKEMILQHTGQEINNFASENFGGEGKTKKVPLGSEGA